jgi:hypothetical protein
MNTLPLQSKTQSTVEALASLPILFAFAVGSLPVLIPVLLFRWLARRF